MFNNPFQMLREIAVILDNVRTVEILCNEISRNIWGHLRIRIILYAKEFCRVLYHYRFA